MFLALGTFLRFNKERNVVKMKDKLNTIVHFSRFLILIVFMFILMATIGGTTVAYADGQYAMWVQDDVRLTQGIEGNYSHTGMNSIDIVGVANSDIKAPFDATIVEIQATYEWGNAIIITSKDKVHYADGSYDYMTVIATHDNDISDCYVGRELRQGEVFAQHGNYGYASGVHTHLTVVRGQYAGYAIIPQTGYYKYVNDMNPADALFLYDSTVVYETCGLNFRRITVPATYTVSYNANGGENPPPAQTKQQGTALTLSSSVPTHRSEISEGYTVSFDANGGSVSPTSKTEIITTTFSFKSWNTASNGRGTSYAPGATYTRDEDVTLYADWGILTLLPGSMTLPIPTRTGYRALGWSTSPTAATAQYQPGEHFKPDKNMTLYAIWERLTYTVHYNANGGKGAPADQVKTYGQAITLSSDIPTRTGFTFLGWGTNASATTPSYQPGASYSAEGNVTLYAIWKFRTFTVYNSPYLRDSGADKAIYITGDFSDFKGFEIADNLDARASVSLRTNQYEIRAYSRLTFACAFLDSLSGGEYYIFGTNEWRDPLLIGKISITPAYTITYDANGGTDAPLSQNKIHDTALTLSSDEPKREASTGRYTVRFKTIEEDGTTIFYNPVSVPWTTSYTFKNWNTDKYGTGTSYAPGATYTANASATLYAQWNSTKTTGSVPFPDSPTRPGYVFMGWATRYGASRGNFGSYTPTRDGDVTLYATWKKMDIVLPEALNEIESEAFDGCAFSSVMLSEKTATISGRAFVDCPNLKYIYIPAATTAIAADAFAGVDGLTILGAHGSYAETYATAHGYTFISVS